MCTERNESLLESADGSMATVATRREKKSLFPKHDKNRLDSDRPSHGRPLHVLTLQAGFEVKLGFSPVMSIMRCWFGTLVCSPPHEASCSRQRKRYTRA